MASSSNTESFNTAGYKETATTNSDKSKSTSMEMEHLSNEKHATKGPAMYKGLRKRKIGDAEDDEDHKKADTFDAKRPKANGSARPDKETANNEQKSQSEGQGVADVKMGGTEEEDGLDPELMEVVRKMAVKPKAEVQDDMNWAEIYFP